MSNFIVEQTEKVTSGLDVAIKSDKGEIIAWCYDVSIANIIADNLNKLSKSLVCQDCGKQDETVREDICPYAGEINNKEIEIIVCQDCYHERYMDI